jgi:hypothetical protein
MERIYSNSVPILLYKPLKNDNVPTCIKQVSMHKRFRVLSILIYQYTYIRGARVWTQTCQTLEGNKNKYGFPSGTIETTLLNILLKQLCEKKQENLKKSRKPESDTVPLEYEAAVLIIILN